MSAKTISFCFDDGFLASSEKILRLFESRGAKASFCVMAAPEASEDSAHRGARFADWDFWRGVRTAGHDVAPHGWAHERFAAMTDDDARAAIERMFDRFVDALPGFRPDGAIFHTPYLAMPPALIAWLRPRCAAIRIARGAGGMTSPAEVARSGLVDCIAFGPSGVGAAAAAQIERFASGNAEWQVLVLHGVDGEGWGPLALDELAAILDDSRNRGLVIRPLGDILIGGAAPPPA